MSSPTRLLFPQLPPELRNEIYSYLSTSSSITAGLPLPPKTYSCKHTVIHLCATHSGSSALLALREHNVLEAFEYTSWLHTHALELKLGIRFTGRVNTFDPAAWAKKTEAHLRKLAKRYVWLGKVARYDVRILWEPVDGVLRSRKGRTAGRMVGEMVRALMGVMNTGLVRKRGRVNVEVVLGRGFAVTNTLSHLKFGLKDFLEGGEWGCSKVTKSVWRQAPMKEKEEGELLEVEGGVVRWGRAWEGDLVMRRTVEQAKTPETVIGDVGRGEDGHFDFVTLELVEECLGRR